MATKDAPKDQPAGDEGPKDIFTFTPEEVAAADTSIPDGDQWNKRDQAARDAVTEPAPAPAPSNTSK